MQNLQPPPQEQNQSQVLFALLADPSLGYQTATLVPQKMTKNQILLQLKNNQLTSHERETLLQLLHYMQAEGITATDSVKHTGTKTKRTARRPTHKPYAGKAN
jgi:hypothetical protein